MEGIAGLLRSLPLRSFWSGAFFSRVEDLKLLEVCKHALAWRTKQGRILTKDLVLDTHP